MMPHALAPLTVMILLSAAAGGVCAQGTRPVDVAGWIGRMAESAGRLNYSGIYVYQTAGRVETMRVTHLVDNTGEYEKIASLDGPAREVVRHNDQIRCYLPDARTVRVDRLRTKRFFPALLENSGNLSDGYAATIEGTDRVAGYECQVVLLQPKDNLRFAHRFCADIGTGLMLRASTLNDRREMIEQFTFTEVRLGGRIGRDELKPTFADRQKSWQTDDSAIQQTPAGNTGWDVKGLPAGFRKIVETRRAIDDTETPVVHQIYSDGLAAVSVFIRANGADGSQGAGPIRHGRHPMYVRTLPDQPYTVTVLGEVPEASLERIANSLALSPAR